MKHHRRQKLREQITFLSREHAQMRPEALTLSVISGTSVLAVTRLSDSAANALIGVVRLFV
ncbi:MAG: hypothetical protein V7645_1642 [Actinomycetota bacterium]